MNFIDATRLGVLSAAVLAVAGVFALLACGPMSVPATEAPTLMPTPTLGLGCGYMRNLGTRRADGVCRELGPGNIEEDLLRMYNDHVVDLATRQARGKLANRPDTFRFMIHVSTEDAAGDVLDFLGDVTTWGPVSSSDGGIRSGALVSAVFSIRLLPEVAAIEGVEQITVKLPSVGGGLSCDNLLQQGLLASPIATEDAAGANTLIAAIQERWPKDCALEIWNPWVTETPGDAPFDVDVPASLTEDGVAAPDTRFASTPWRDGLGNIGIDFATTDGGVRGMPATYPFNGGERWVYVSSQGVWYPPPGPR